MSQHILVLIAVLTTSFVVPFMGSSINLAVPAIGHDFGVNPVLLSWVVSAYILGSVAILLPVSRVADIKGRRRVYSIGAFFMVVFTVLCGFAWSADSLVLFRLGQGLASSCLFSNGMAMIISVYPPEQRGKIIGYSAASTYIGLSLGPVLGGMITHFIGWRGIFYLTAVVLLISFAAILRVKKEWYGTESKSFDVMGSVYYFFASVGILYGCSNFAVQTWAVYCTLGGCLFFVLFVRQQIHHASPLLDIRLFRQNTVFAMSNLAAMINYSATFAISFSLSLYLQIVRGFDASTAGMILLIQPCLMALFSPKAGALSDKVDPRLVASVGMGLNMIGLLIFAFLGETTPLWQLVIAFVVIGIGFALFSSPNNNAIMGAVGPVHYGIAASVLAVMRLMGQALSMAIVTLVLSIYAVDMGTPAYRGELLDGICVTFAVFAVLCAFGIAASLARGSKVKEN